MLMQYEKMSRLAEFNYGQQSEQFIEKFHQEILMQMSYNSGSHEKHVENALHVSTLAAAVYTSQEKEI
jgi:hypothetical protein